jgi:hypothetical protein
LDVSEKPISGALEDINKGLILWKLFVILALLFLAAEVILLRMK